MKIRNCEIFVDDLIYFLLYCYKFKKKQKDNNAMLYIDKNFKL